MHILYMLPVTYTFMNMCWYICFTYPSLLSPSSPLVTPKHLRIAFNVVELPTRVWCVGKRRLGLATGWFERVTTDIVSAPPVQVIYLLETQKSVYYQNLLSPIELSMLTDLPHHHSLF